MSKISLNVPRTQKEDTWFEQKKNRSMFLVFYDFLDFFFELESYENSKGCD